MSTNELPDGVSAKEFYEMCRSQIEHEDGLVNNRVSWYLVTQGILFSAAGALVKTSGGNDTILGLHGTLGAVILISAIGILISLMTLLLLNDAWYHLGCIREKYYQLVVNHDRFPRLMGQSPPGGRLKQLFLRVFQLSNLPWMVTGAWAVIGLYAIYRLFHR